jgi:hypothetical protein
MPFGLNNRRLDTMLTKGKTFYGCKAAVTKFRNWAQCKTEVTQSSTIGHYLVLTFFPPNSIIGHDLLFNCMPNFITAQDLFQNFTPCAIIGNDPVLSVIPG